MADGKRIVYIPLKSEEPTTDTRTLKGELVVKASTGEIFYKKEDDSIVSIVAAGLGGTGTGVTEVISDRGTF